MQTCNKKILFYIVLLGLGLSFSQKSRADITIHNGPPAGGQGGPNPIDIPPLGIAGYEVVIITDRKREWTIGLIPGLFYGQRFVGRGSTYFSTGGGVVIGFNGIGPGFYSAFGVDLCGFVCFNIEYKKSIGFDFTGGRIISPYALRIGITMEL